MKTTTTAGAVVKFETRGVLAGAYKGKGIDRTTLSHSVGMDATGRDVKVLCRGVKLDNVPDPFGYEEGELPTCPTCAERLARATAKLAK
jgi:hypothetical protein